MLKFIFSVGENEIHEIEFKFNQCWGNLHILVDGEKIIGSYRQFSDSLTRTFELNVGIEEIHQVRIEKIRKLVFAGFREHVGKVYIDEYLLYEFKGKLNLDDILMK